MSYKVVVVGATGNVGREMLNILDEREFPIAEIAVLASRKSLGTEVSFGNKTLKTTDLASFDFAGWDMALFAVGSEATKEYAPKAAAAGCIVIDNSSLYRYDPDVPLIVPEVNADAIFGCHKKNIIANPNCSTAQCSGCWLDFFLPFLFSDFFTITCMICRWSRNKRQVVIRKSHRTSILPATIHHIRATIKGHPRLSWNPTSNEP